MSGLPLHSSRRWLRSRRRPCSRPPQKLKPKATDLDLIWDLFCVTKSKLWGRERSNCSPQLPELELQELWRETLQSLVTNFIDNNHQLWLGTFRQDMRKNFSINRLGYRFIRWIEESPTLDVFKTLPGKAMAFCDSIIHSHFTGCVYIQNNASVKNL